MNFKNIGSVWIWRDLSSEPNQYVTFKQTFDVTNTSNSKLYICCDTNYAAYINGKLVGYGQYLGYPENKYYDILDISDALVRGENELIIDAYYQGVSTHNYCSGLAGLIYTIYADEKHISNLGATCKKAAGFKEGSIHNLTSQLGPSFEYDARDKGGVWADVIVLEFTTTLPISLRRRPVKKLVTSGNTPFKAISAGKFIPYEESNNPAERMQKAYMAPFDYIKIKQLTDGEFVITEDNTFITLDLEGEAAGYFTIELEASAGVRIDAGYGEHLTGGRLRIKNNKQNFAFSYTTKDGENTFTNYFRRIGAKYIQLNFYNVKETVKLRYAGLIKAEYPVTEASPPPLVDYLDKQIYKIAVNTLKLCMHEHYEDSPWRGQALRSMDSRIQSLCGYYAFKDSYKFAKASIELMGSSLKEDGFLDICAPSLSKSTIPSFTLIWLVWLAEYVAETKDKNFLMQNENKIWLILKSWEKRITNGIISIPSSERVRNFFEWEEGLSAVDMYDTNVLINLYFCYALKKLLKSEKHFRSKDIIFKMKKLYKTVKSAVNKTFYDRADKIYLTYADTDIHKCKLSQIMAICSGVAKRPKRLRKILVNDKSLVPVTLSSKVFEYEALEPEIKKYGSYILNDVRNIWGKMVFDGADTFWETTSGSDGFEGSASLCHGRSAVPIYAYNMLFNTYKN